MKNVITITNPEPAIKLTPEQATALGIDYTQDEIRGELKTFGAWSIPVSFKALCMSATYGVKEDSFISSCLDKTIYGNRTMTNVRQGGYELEGYVSVKGKKYSCFTSSQLFDINGHLVNVAVIHARIK